jgi:hypothetical protein
MFEINETEVKVVAKPRFANYFNSRFVTLNIGTPQFMCFFTHPAYLYYRTTEMTSLNKPFDRKGQTDKQNGTNSRLGLVVPSNAIFLPVMLKCLSVVVRQ